MLHQTGEFIRLKKKKMVIFLFVVQGDVVLPALLSKNTDLEKIYTYPCNGSNWGNARRMNHRTENLIRGREDESWYLRDKVSLAKADTQEIIRICGVRWNLMLLWKARAAPKVQRHLYQHPAWSEMVEFKRLF